MTNETPTGKFYQVVFKLTDSDSSGSVAEIGCKFLAFCSGRPEGCEPL